MRKIFIIFAVLILALVVGCAKVQKQPETPTAQGADTGSSESISEADSIETITDAEGDKELDSVGSTLAGW